jgi:hypothetical protein
MEKWFQETYPDLDFGVYIPEITIEEEEKDEDEDE